MGQDDLVIWVEALQTLSVQPLRNHRRCHINGQHLEFGAWQDGQGIFQRIDGKNRLTPVGGEVVGWGEVESFPVIILLPMRGKKVRL